MPRWLQFGIFFTVVLAILGALHVYLWARLVRATVLPPPWKQVATGGLIALALAVPLAGITSRFAPPIVGRLAAWPAYIWLGLAFIAFLLLVASDMLRLIVAAATRLTSEAPPSDPVRRTAMARVAAGAVAAAATVVGALAVRGALAPVAVREVSVALPQLPAAREGTTIVQLTDLHIGPTIGRAWLEEIVRRTNALHPDVVAITGDLVDGDVEALRDAVSPLGDLRAKYGVYFVTGNHEYFSDADAWLAELGRLRVRVLRNERTSIGDDDASSFDLCGIDDWTAARYPGHGADLPKALAGRDTRRASVLLAHQPKAVHQAALMGVDLQISGHTHGGQIWPFGYLVKLQQPYLAGLSRAGDTQIYVSRGTGYWGPPMRLGAPAEITRITLRRGPGAATA